MFELFLIDLIRLNNRLIGIYLSCYSSFSFSGWDAMTVFNVDMVYIFLFLNHLLQLLSYTKTYLKTLKGDGNRFTIDHNL